MAGTIVADDIQHSTAGSVGTEYVVNGSAKAWGTVDNSGATMTLKESFNQSSVTDDATARATYTWTNSLANDDYALSGMSGTAGTNGKMVSMNTVATGYVQVEDRFHDNGQSPDSFNWSVIIHGDLA